MWSSRFLQGGVTGAFAMSIAYLVGSPWGIIPAFGVISLCALWYHIGKGTAYEESIRDLRELKNKMAGNA